MCLNRPISVPDSSGALQVLDYRCKCSPSAQNTSLKTSLLGRTPLYPELEHITQNQCPGQDSITPRASESCSATHMPSAHCFIFVYSDFPQNQIISREDKNLDGDSPRLVLRERSALSNPKARRQLEVWWHPTFTRHTKYKRSAQESNSRSKTRWSQLFLAW